MRRVLKVFGVVGILLLGFLVGKVQSQVADQITIRIVVSSADHEVSEGYFSLGDDTTLITKPGTDLYRFLVRNKSRKVIVTFVEAPTGPEKISR